ncbi:conserved hypothetical protein [Nostocoides australiense Ben110]|uniref:Uncharacterized protein n=1 Tax=Nostocoides australiense Ben110 TaxID=1193182 RepID=W6JSN1_9MICO|nr:conserved hypothetical protein [Tetrasphaera australiensis Ben110]
MLDPDAPLAGGQEVLDRRLLGPVDDVLDHRPGVEVLEVEDLLVAAGVGDLEETVVLVLGIHARHRGLDHRLHRGLGRAAVLGDVVRVQRQVGGEVFAEDVARRLRVRAFDLDLHIEPAGPQDRRVDHVLAVGRADDDDVLETLDPVDLGQQLRHDRRLDVTRHAGPTGAEERVHLVEEDHHGRAVVGLLPRPVEDQPDVPLGLADIFVEQFRALDVEEVALGERLALLLGDLARQRGGNRLGDHGLAAAGRAVEQHALGRLELVLGKQIRMQIGQFDRVADRLDLTPQAADVLVGDVGDLLQHQVRDLGLLDALEDEPAARLEQQCVADADRHVREGLGHAAYPLLVGVRDHEHPVRLDHLLDEDDLTDALITADGHDIEGLVEADIAPAHQIFGRDGRADGDVHLAAAGEDVGGAVVVDLQDDAVCRGRIGEPVDLDLEVDQLLAGILEGAHEALVLGGHGGHLRAHTAQFEGRVFGHDSLLPILLPPLRERRLFDSNSRIRQSVGGIRHGSGPSHALGPIRGFRAADHGSWLPPR